MGTSDAGRQVEGLRATARELMRQFKGHAYAFGPGAIARAGEMAARLGRRFLLVRGKSAARSGMLERLRESFRTRGLEIAAECAGAAPNSPVEDVQRVRDEVLRARPDAAVGLGGGSLIDALKGSVVLASLGGGCEDYYGVGKVSARLRETGKRLLPHFAVMTASASAAHLTKYANITDMRAHQKRLVIDEAVVPPAALFDYRATLTMSAHFTMVGAFDGICHLLEVYFGLPAGHARQETVERVALTGLELIVGALPGALKEPACEPLRESIGLGTDLGGYAIMIGSTNGPHLNSFSLVDLMDHGMATALLTPYYVCFFAPAIEEKLRRAGRVYQQHGYVDGRADLDRLGGRDLGLAVARGMAALAGSLGFPTRLDDVPGFGGEHVERMLAAAKDPALSSKLEAMPIPMAAADVDRYMAPILEAARTGDFTRIVPHAHRGGG
jgi:alcohol dehydrogenase